MNKKVLAGTILAIISIVMSLVSIIVCASIGCIEIAIQTMVSLFADVFSSGPMMMILAIVYYLVVIVGIILFIVSLVRSIKYKIGLSWLNVGASVVLFAATFLSFPLFVALTSSTDSLLLIITISFAFGLILLCVAIGVMPKKLLEVKVTSKEKSIDQLQEVANYTMEEKPVVEEVSVEEPEVVAAPTSDEVPSEVVNEEPMKEEVTEQPVEEEKSVEEKKSASKSSTPKRIYHISERKELNKWQIKFAGGTKALKMFNTQAEAIAYAKELIAKNGGSYRVHSRAGKMRKA